MTMHWLKSTIIMLGLGVSGLAWGQSSESEMTEEQTAPVETEKSVGTLPEAKSETQTEGDALDRLLKQGEEGLRHGTQCQEPAPKTDPVV